MDTLPEINSNQFFQKEHYKAFEIEKIYLNTKGILDERKNVQLRLLELHDILFPEIQRRGWALHEHNSKEHLVSGIDIENPFIPNRVQSIWLHYGKSEYDIKQYKKLTSEKEKETFIQHIRLQVIIFHHSRLNQDYYGVGTWLVFGKPDGSIWDRDYLRLKLREDEVFNDSLFHKLKKLDENYFLNVNDEMRQVGEIMDVSDLVSYLLDDDPHKYLILGKDFEPNYPGLSNEAIVQTVLSEFSSLYPIYELVKHRIPDF